MTPIRLAAIAAITATIVATAACSSDPTPAEPSDAGTPTISRWLNQPCPSEGSHAKTISGGDLVCKQVGSDAVPEWHAAGEPETSDPTPESASSTPAGTTPGTEVYYRTCSDAKAAGAAPIRRGQPGYRAALDRDGDGIACDK